MYGRRVGTVRRVWRGARPRCWMHFSLCTAPPLAALREARSRLRSGRQWALLGTAQSWCWAPCRGLHSSASGARDSQVRVSLTEVRLSPVPGDAGRQAAPVLGERVSALGGLSGWASILPRGASAEWPLSQPRGPGPLSSAGSPCRHGQFVFRSVREEGSRRVVHPWPTPASAL